MMYTQKSSGSDQENKKKWVMKTALQAIYGEEPRFTVPKLRKGVPKYGLQFVKYR